MIRLDQYPSSVFKEICSFSGVTNAWARAAGLQLDDVRQEIAAACLAGLNPARAVPAALGIRRLANGDWRALDPIANHCVEFDDDIFVQKNSDYFGRNIDADGIGDVMRRCGIGRRAAQIRVKKQWTERQKYAGADLFGEGAK